MTQADPGPDWATKKPRKLELLRTPDRAAPRRAPQARIEPHSPKRGSGRTPALPSHPSAGGFTLVELLIAMAVVAILAAIAYPSYSAQVRKARRSDAIAALNAVLQAQERWRANNVAYSQSMTDLGVSATSGDGYYTISASTASASAGRRYVATAAAVAGRSQAADTACATMTITADQSQTPSIAYSPAACWSR